MPSSAFARLRNRTSIPAHTRLFGVWVQLLEEDGTTVVAKFKARRDDTFAQAFGLGTGIATTWMLPIVECNKNGTPVTPVAGYRIKEFDTTNQLVNTWQIEPLDTSTTAVEPDHHDNDFICHVRRVEQNA